MYIKNICISDLGLFDAILCPGKMCVSLHDTFLTAGNCFIAILHVKFQIQI